MEVHNTNGVSNGMAPVNSPEEVAPAPQPPACVLYVGNVRARIWANLGRNHTISWRVDLSVLQGGRRSRFSQAFEPEELMNVARAALQARRWVRRQERLLRIARWFSWL